VGLVPLIEGLAMVPLGGLIPIRLSKPPASLAPEPASHSSCSKVTAPEYEPVLAKMRWPVASTLAALVTVAKGWARVPLPVVSSPVVASTNQITGPLTVIVIVAGALVWFGV